MSGKWIDLTDEDGVVFSGYLATPSEGSGPGILLFQEIFGVNASIRAIADLYAEEGYVVLAPDLFWRKESRVDLGYDTKSFNHALSLYADFNELRALEDISKCYSVIKSIPQCIGRVGALGFCLGGRLVHLAAEKIDIDCGVSYYGVGIENNLNNVKNINCPMVYHFGSCDEHVSEKNIQDITDAFSNSDNISVYSYSGASHGFANSQRKDYNKPASLMAHSRSIEIFRSVMGPFYNLSDLWDEHCKYEFGLRDVDKTMDTMVEEPYVNHIPTMTGGVGSQELRKFYTEHFIFSNPSDTKLIPISRTVGSDRVVDELLFSFTHNTEIDWMLPGIAPTGKFVEIPLVAIVCFRGGKLYNEHIYWDQASVLLQIGVLNANGLPVAGVESAKKLINENLPSNTLMKNWK